MAKGDLRIKFIPTTEMIAYCLTKPNPKPAFTKLAARIMGEASLEDYDLEFATLELPNVQNGEFKERHLSPDHCDEPVYREGGCQRGL